MCYILCYCRNLISCSCSLTVAETLCRSIFDPITEGLKAAKLQVPHHVVNASYYRDRSLYMCLPLTVGLDAVVRVLA